jgi:hypothetical protein
LGCWITSVFPRGPATHLNPCSASMKDAKLRSTARPFCICNLDRHEQTSWPCSRAVRHADWILDRVLTAHEPTGHFDLQFRMWISVHNSRNRSQTQVLHEAEPAKCQLISAVQPCRSADQRLARSRWSAPSGPCCFTCIKRASGSCSTACRAADYRPPPRDNGALHYLLC